MTGEICGDNRFKIIAKAKEAILESTNIDTDEDEMKVLDSFLFRCWQMGWLDKYDDTEKKNQWIPCSERLPEPYDDVLISVKGNVFEAHLRESKEYFLEHRRRWLIRTENVDAWCEMPKPYEGGTE